MKIREWAYVDLGSLCVPSDASVLVAIGSYGRPSISLTPSRGRPPTSIFETEWIRLFGVYASIYVECHPSESAALFTYMVNVMDQHPCHGTRAAVTSDQLGRGDGRYSQAAPQAPVPFRQGAPRSAMRATPGGVCFDFNYRGTCTRTCQS